MPCVVADSFFVDVAVVKWSHQFLFKNNFFEGLQFYLRDLKVVIILKSNYETFY